jgi:glutaredoxin 3
MTIEGASVNRVKMYTTEFCPFCIRAKALLRQLGVAEIDEVRVDIEPAERLRMVELTGRRTVPQIFIGAVHVGGCDDLFALERRGALAELLAG